MNAENQTVGCLADSMCDVEVFLHCNSSDTHVSKYIWKQEKLKLKLLIIIKYRQILDWDSILETCIIMSVGRFVSSQRHSKTFNTLHCMFHKIMQFAIPARFLFWGRVFSGKQLVQKENTKNWY